MKIVIVSDKHNSAIDRIAQMQAMHLRHLDIVICPVHPKRPDDQQLNFFLENVKDADIIDFEYWKTARMLLTRYPGVNIGKRTILAHHNPYDIDKEDWHEFDVNIAKNKDIHSRMPGSTYVHIPVDMDFFAYNNEYDDSSKIVLMVANRIESKKGILEVARACKELKLKFVLVGAISDANYFNSIVEQGVEFHEQISDEELRALYYKAAIHVCNSEDGFESGTMPILESMSCGLPVLTRNIGHVPDLYNGSNLKIRHGAKEDVIDLMVNITELLSNSDERKKMRKQAWDTVRNFSSKRSAWMYEKIYHELYSKDPLVSVIIPTHNRFEVLKENLLELNKQTYGHFEVIVVDDNSDDGTYLKLAEMRITKQFKYPLSIYKTEKKDPYNLGLARNLGAIYSSGEQLVFLDDRQCPEPNAIQQFMDNREPHTFMYGIKDGIKKGFVENFSSVPRQEFIDAGMFSVGQPYGFLSQETRGRFNRQGFKFKYVLSAKARTLTGTHNRAKKMNDIRKSKDLLFKMGYGDY